MDIYGKQKKEIHNAPKNHYEKDQRDITAQIDWRFVREADCRLFQRIPQVSIVLL